MGTRLAVNEQEVTIEISGFTALATLKKKVRIPFALIEEVKVGSFEFPWKAIKRTGITTSSNKVGHFLIGGKQYFLSYQNGDEVLILHLKGHDFDRVVIQSENPKQLATGISARCSSS